MKSSLVKEEYRQRDLHPGLESEKGCDGETKMMLGKEGESTVSPFFRNQIAHPTSTQTAPTCSPGERMNR
jgi:hypothetical protein